MLNLRTTFLRMTLDPTRTLLSLYRKFLWANELYARYRSALRREGSFMHHALQTSQVGSFEECFRSEMYLCLWFSTLYVVIEGWPALRQRDPTLTPLLRSPNKDLLRRFRDATFHPTHWNDARLAALVSKGQSSFEWVEQVTLGFRRFFAPVAREDRAQRRRLPRPKRAHGLTSA